MNIIKQDSNWSPFLGSDQYKTFENFIDQLIALDTSDVNSWVKWKCYSNQVVVQSECFFYKLYQEDFQHGQFICAIREKLAEIYSEEYGIHWSINTVKTKEGYVQIEQREKLEVCPKDFPIEKILLGWRDTLTKLENKLNLKLVEYQVRQVIPGIKQIKLIRDCISKHADYAVKDGRIILLDDADWFLALLDEDANWIKPRYEGYQIEYNNQPMLFAPEDFTEVDLLSKTNCEASKWSIFYLPEVQLYNRCINSLFDKREEVISNVIKLLTKNTACLDSKRIYSSNLLEALP